MLNTSITTKQRTRRITLFLFVTVAVTLLFVNAASAQDGSENVKTGLTSGRLRSILIGVLGLISMILGIRYFVRSSKSPASSQRRNGMIIAAIVGLTCIILAAVHIANSTGGFGTGSGKAGSIIAMVLGIVGTTLSALSLARSGRTGSARL